VGENKVIFPRVTFLIVMHAKGVKEKCENAFSSPGETCGKQKLN